MIFHSSRPQTKKIRLFIGLTGFCLSLTLLFLAMRAVMNVGGYCAEGGAYEIETHCPKGVAAIAPLSIFGMMIFGGIAVFSANENGFKLAIIFWSALFTSLGWNFFEYAFNPPDGSGLVVGWLICGILFAIMGLGPIFLMIHDKFFLKAKEVFENNNKKLERFSKQDYQLAGFCFFSGILGISIGYWLYNIITN